MSANENPYASPVAASEATNRQIAMRRLRPPAIGLLIGAILMLSMLMLGWVSATIMYLLGRGEVAELQFTIWAEYWYAFAAIVCCNAFVVYVSIQMLRVRQYPACIIGALVAGIPMLSPCYVLGIPFAIWALIILVRKETRAAFAEAS